MRHQWLKYKRDIFLSSDFLFGAIVGVGLAVGGTADHKIIPGRAMLYAEIALSAAILSVALIALSVLVAVLGDNLFGLLQEIGLRSPFLPYQSVAVVSAIGILAAMFSIFIWPIAPIWLIIVSSAIVAGITTWAVVGGIQLINVTAKLAKIPYEIRRATRDDDQDSEASLRSVKGPQGNQSPADTHT